MACRQETKKGRSKRITLLTPQPAIHECAPVRKNNTSAPRQLKTILVKIKGVPNKILAGAEGFEPSTYGFGDRRSTN
jgi:hypothetical protein